MTSKDYSTLHDTTLSVRLEDVLRTIVAVGDVLGSARVDELAADTSLHLGQLIYQLGREANVLSEEMWSRLRDGKAEAGYCSSLEESSDDDVKSPASE